ncbi:trypsin-like peptidase domain-containing protein [Nonomuraea fuscirosea]|uniref:trypsin-like peptidase domain-containing protein n=1 Tax=Nonomuraea fuscirosea TaxID=1291556 RepID=UPI003434F737
MGPGSASWVAAIYTSENARQPTGAGVVIDERRVLTCAHLLADTSAEPANVLTSLWIEFPKAYDALDVRIRGVVKAVATKAADDVAIILLDTPIPEGIIPARIRSLNPDDLGRGDHWWAFGFPHADPFGDSASGIIGEVLGRGWVRLDCESSSSLARGFSGSGLWSDSYEAVIGVIGQAANTGTGGRAITIYRANQSLRDENLFLLDQWSAVEAGEVALASWGWTLGRDPEGVRHWRPRARGVTIDSERGYRFQGRSKALTEIVSWLARDQLSRLPLVVTGSPGVGKSAVLGRIVTSADPTFRAELPPHDEAVRAPEGSIACAVHAKGKTALDVATEIARAASAALPEIPEDLAPAIQSALRGRHRRFNIVIDALDEATSPSEARAIINRIVLPLTETCSDSGVQIVVGTRRQDDGGDLLRELGNPRIINLDSSEFFALEDLTRYAMATLQLLGDERPDNPYKLDALAHPVAERIAQLAEGNFLLAGLVARRHGLHDHKPANPDTLSFPSHVGTALRLYIERIPVLGEVPVKLALTVLAFAEAPGLPLDLWGVAIRALDGPDVTKYKLAQFAKSSVANFLVETSRIGQTSVIRLFHQALNDTLLEDRANIISRSDDEASITKAFQAEGQRNGWRSVPAYLLHSLPSHALRAGMLEKLVRDDDYILHVDASRLVTAVMKDSSYNTQSRARLLRLTPGLATANAAFRDALLSVSEVLFGLGESFHSSTRIAPYRGCWAIVAPYTEQVILSHPGEVIGVCAFQDGGRTFLASIADDKVVRIWDLAVGTEVHALTGHEDEINDVCVFPMNGRAMLVSASDDATLRIWDPQDGRETRRISGHVGGVAEVYAFQMAGRTVLASRGSFDGVIRIWDPRTGAELRHLELTTFTSIRGICAFQHGDYILFAAISSSGRDSGRICLWEMSSGREIVRSSSPVNKWEEFVIDGNILRASKSDEADIRLWDPNNNTQLRRLTTEISSIRGECVLQLNDRVIKASPSREDTVLLKDAATGTQVRRFFGHSDMVTGVCSVQLGERVLLASSSLDGTVRIWDPATGAEAEQLSSSINWVACLTVTLVDGRKTLISTSFSDDATVWSYDLATGDAIRRFEGHSAWVQSVCTFELEGRPVFASCSADETLTIWDLASGSQILRLYGHERGVVAVCAYELNGMPWLASGSDDGTVRIWDAVTGEESRVLVGHADSVRDICAFRLHGRAMLGSASDDGTVRVWDAAVGEQVHELVDHGDWVNAVCSFEVDDLTLLASASTDETIILWDPDAGSQIFQLVGHTDSIRGICSFRVGKHVALASASYDKTVKLWDPVSASEIMSIPVHQQAFNCVVENDMLVVGLETGILAVRLDLQALENLFRQ